MIELTNSIRPLVEFLSDTLADGPVAVSDLEARARASGLLDHNRRIGQAKGFRKAKKHLGVQSVRSGFGAKGGWAWRLPDGARTHPRDAGKATPRATEQPQAPDGPVPPSWVKGIALLRHRGAPSDVPPHRWRQFVDDCSMFLEGDDRWAERAAELGWDDLALFGCRRIRPFDYLGDAGLLWFINGDKLVQLHREWAVIERSSDREHRVHERRRPGRGYVTLPWIGLRKRSSA